MIAGNFVNKVRGIVKSKNINAWGINNFISQKTKTKVQFFGENQKSTNYIVNVKNLRKMQISVCIKLKTFYLQIF